MKKLILALFLMFALASFVSACQPEGYSCGYQGGGQPECCAGLTCAYFQCFDQSSVVCGDDVCQYPETRANCPEDCGEPPVCGDGICEPGETIGALFACPEDCDFPEIQCTYDNYCKDILGENYVCDDGQCILRECESCWDWAFGEGRDCDEGDVWEAEGWLGRAFGASVNHGMWCPIYFVILTGTALIFLSIIIMIFSFTRRKRK